MAQHDMTAASSNVLQPAARSDTLAGKTIGLLGNRKRNNGAFLRLIGEAGRRMEPSLSVVSWEKPSVYRPLSRKMTNEILESCDGLISGLGD